MLFPRPPRTEPSRRGRGLLVARLPVRPQPACYYLCLRYDAVAGQCAKGRHQDAWHNTTGYEKVHRGCCTCRCMLCVDRCLPHASESVGGLRVSFVRMLTIPVCRAAIASGCLLQSRRIGVIGAGLWAHSCVAGDVTFPLRGPLGCYGHTSVSRLIAER